MKYTILKRAFCCSFALLAIAPAVSAQDINIGVACGGGDQDVNQITRNAVDQNFLLNDHLAFIRARHTFDEDGGWDWQGGILDEEDPTRPFNKYLVASLLTTHGVQAPEPPVKEVNGFFMYDDSAFYLSPAFNRASEYELLVRSKSVSACQKVNLFTGAMSCAPDHYENGIWADVRVQPPTYGRAVELLLMNIIPNDGAGVILGKHSGSGGTISYACPLFDDAQGVAKLSETMVHENWHGMNEPGHVDCPAVPGDDGACAAEWSFEAPRHSRYHNTLAVSTTMDSYQTGLRFACDLTDAAQDWVPIMTQLEANQVAIDLSDRNIFQNIIDSTGTMITGLAPYTCGAPRPILNLVPGVHSCSTGSLRCDADSQCNTGAGELCVDGCCSPPIIVK